MFRSSTSTILLAYYEYYGILSSIVAETRAVLSGLLLLPPSVTAIWLELDSVVLVQIFKEEAQCPWHIFYYIKAIKHILKDTAFYISHGFREANYVADGLANEAVTQQD